MFHLSSFQLQRVVPLLARKQKSAHLIFRVLGSQFQSKYSQDPVLVSAPKAFIHGNPHLDNYVRTFNGSGMVDFDRSRMGPYCWDLIRLFSSLYLSSKLFPALLPQKIYKITKKGYLATFNNPDILHAEPSFLHSLRPLPHELSTNDYLEAKKKWAKKLFRFSVPKDNPDIVKMLNLFLKSRNEKKLLKYFYLEKAARSPGSLGKEHILFSLAPFDKEHRRDRILIDIKETYCEEDTSLFYSPTEHQGLRMIRASNLYAPNIEQRLGYFTFQKNHYWGREVPAFNAKIKTTLENHELEELGYCIGAQLGRAHRISLLEHPKYLRSHLKKNFPSIQQIAVDMSKSVLKVHKKLSKKHL